MNTHRTSLTRAEAEAFLELQDRTRVTILRQLNRDERARILVSLILALASDEAEREELAA